MGCYGMEGWGRSVTVLHLWRQKRDTGWVALCVHKHFTDPPQPLKSIELSGSECTAVHFVMSTTISIRSCLSAEISVFRNSYSTVTVITPLVSRESVYRQSLQVRFILTLLYKLWECQTDTGSVLHLNYQHDNWGYVIPLSTHTQLYFVH